jgi:Peptidase family M1 domain
MQTAGAAVPSEKSAANTDARALYQALNALRPDGAKVYDVKGLNLIRDVVHLTLDEGKLAFYQPLDGRITGAVFLGRGHVIATPHDPGERRSLAQYVGVPILDQTFTRAYLRFDDETATELQTILQNDGAAVASNPDFSAGWAAIVTSLNPWHSLRLLVDWLSANPQPYFYAALAGDSRGAFDVLVDNRREEQVVFGQPRTENGALFYDVWASFRGESADANSADAPSGPAFVPIDYRVDTAIGDDLSLEGTASLHLRVARAGERVVPLELSKNLAIEQITGLDGNPIVFFQNADLSQREVRQRGNDTVLAVLPAPSHAGDELRLEVKYHGNVIVDVGNGVEFVGERGTWYAHSPDENFCSFDLTFRWPKKFVLVATGTQTESHDDANFKTGHWKSQQPMSVAGFNLGEYDGETAGSGRPTIQLFANRQLENAILARIAQNESGIAAITAQGPGATGNPGGTPFGAGGPVPSPSAVLRNLSVDVSDSIHFFEKFNGPFPFDRLEISQIPGSFGQGWPGLVYLSTLAFLPPETEQRAGIGTEEQEEARELMPFHEIAHQWWGNLTGSPGYRDDWIQEGMANYLAILYAESRNPSKHRLTTWLERYRTELLRKEPGTDETSDEAGPLDLGIRLGSSKTPDAYVRVTYGKGTWVMHMLREMLRDPTAKDPDARFRQLLQSILTDYRYRTLSAAEFEREIEKVMTPAMDLEGNHSMKWFFDEWVRETGIPHYAVQFQAKARKEEFLITGKLVQSEVRDDFTAPIPIYAVRSGQKPELLGVVVTAGPETRFQFVSHTRPSRLVADPQLTVLHRPN